MTACTCPTHIDDLVEDVLPDPSVGDETTVGDLLACHSMTVERDTSGGPGEWTVWLGDEARAFFDPGAGLLLDDAIDAHPFVDGVDWEDRETLIVVAPHLCESGVLAVVALALLDPETGNRRD